MSTPTRRSLSVTLASSGAACSLAALTFAQALQVPPPAASSVPATPISTAGMSSGFAAGSGPPIETIGPWTVTAADSASLISGGGSSWGWLNVFNAPVSVNNALAGSRIADSGYANASTGTTLEVTFDSGVVNGAGSDLVLFDARYDHGDYAVSTDHDGFVAEVTPTFVDSGVTRNYYYEKNLSQSPFPASIFGAEVDLSSLGVPEGTSVHSVRFRTLDPAGDPLGVGALLAAPILTISGLVAGGTVDIAVHGATPGGRVIMTYSLAGGGPTLVDAGPCGNTLLDVATPFVQVLLTADPGGTATWTRDVPAELAGVQIWFHALDLSTCQSSNSLTDIIG